VQVIDGFLTEEEIDEALRQLADPANVKALSRSGLECEVRFPTTMPMGEQREEKGEEGVASRVRRVLLCADGDGRDRDSAASNTRDPIDTVYSHEDLCSDELDDDVEVEVETDPRVIKLQQQISILSTNILSKSFTDKTLLAMFDQLDDLKREMAALKGIDLPAQVDLVVYYVVCMLRFDHPLAFF
jgi:hypothetical protein